MRFRPRSALVPFALAGWIAFNACSTFRGEDPDASVEAGIADANVVSEGSVPAEGGTDGCAGCELIGGELHGKLVEWDPSGLDTGQDAVFFSGRNPTRALLWKIAIEDGGGAAPAVVMHDGKNISQVNIGSSSIFFAADVSGNDLLSSLDKGATPPTLPAMFVGLSGVTWIGVAANEVVAASATQLTACTYSFGACRAIVAGATIVRAAAGGDDACFIGTQSTNTGLHCGAVPAGSPPPAFKRAEPSPSITAMAVRGSRAYWATPAVVRWEPLGNAEGETFAIPGVTALALDGEDLYYAVGSDLFRCRKDGCASSVRLASAPATISFIAPEDRQKKVYFLYGKGAASRIARVPR